MKISLIVAAARNNVIGKDNQLLWHLPQDLRYFKNTTWGMPVIMGRKTYESVNKPLPGRMNIVITRQAGWSAEGVQKALSLGEALRLAATANVKEAFVIGGGEIYRQAIAVADKIYLTRIQAVFEGDTFFPEIDPAQWELASSHAVEADEKNPYDFSFEVWEKKK